MNTRSVDTFYTRTFFTQYLNNCKRDVVFNSSINLILKFYNTRMNDFDIFCNIINLL